MSLQADALWIELTGPGLTFLFARDMIVNFKKDDNIVIIFVNAVIITVLSPSPLSLIIEVINPILY